MLVVAGPTTGHDGGGHPERPARLDAVMAGLSELEPVRIPAEPANRDDLLRVHTPDYLDRLDRLCRDGGGHLDADTYVRPDSWDVAVRAAGAGLAAVSALRDGAGTAAFVAVRPPGHHAEPGRGMGFCLLNNVAVAAAALAADGERVLIVDWDVHHGNGAQEIFWDDPSVLTVSVHQEGYFPPGSGDVSERGGDGAFGTNLNVPLPPGTGHDAYLALADEVLVPRVRAHRPDLLIICSGYDSSAMDPMGRMLLHSDSYRRLTERFLALADEVCGGRLVVVQEGGYSPAYTPFCGLAVLEALSGAPAAEDPFLDVFREMPGQGLTDEQRRYIAAAAADAR